MEAWRRFCTDIEDTNEVFRLRVRSSLVNRVFLLKKLCHLKLGSNTMEAHIGEMLSTVDELKAPGKELKEQLADTMMLGSLPEPYEMLVSALEVRPETELTILDVKEKLIQEHQRHHSVETVVLKTSSPKDNQRKKSSGNSKNK
uniref:Retrovirus-related Pol polyprotein from transposon TNT 1-94 n=1 Tax=Megaselia scalaris TaxID=36166 RepID=T1GHI1_MEGSC